MKRKHTTQELDGSLNDFIELARSAFLRRYGNDDPDRISPWVTDVFEDYVIAREGSQHYRVGMDVADDGEITFDARQDWQEVRLSYVAELLERQQVRDVMIVTELRGSYPDVALFDDIDYDALIEGDDEPVFLTIPIGKANVKSGNNRYYDDAFVRELERQVRTTKPIGLMGHLKLEDRATEFPQEAVHWVGAARVGELLWGKGYVPPGEARSRIKRYKAQNKRIATSIDAWLGGTWDDTLKAYRVDATSLELSQIDIAPADRAGVADLAAVPLLTTEMTQQPPPNGNHNQYDSEDQMEKEQIIREMTPADARLLPQAVRDAVTSEAPDAQAVREMRTALGLGEGDDLVDAVKALHQDREAANRERVSRRIKELIEDAEKGVKVQSLRGMVQELVEARQPATPEDAERVFGDVMELEHVKAALADQVQRTMGPNYQRPTGAQPADGEHTFINIPQEEAEA